MGKLKKYNLYAIRPIMYHKAESYLANYYHRAIVIRPTILGQMSRHRLFCLGRCNKTGTVKSTIQFRQAVKHVEYDDDNDVFKVVVKDLVKNVVLPTQTFDYVVVASGHFSVPNVPEFEGLVKKCYSRRTPGACPYPTLCYL